MALCQGSWLIFITAVGLVLPRELDGFYYDDGGGLLYRCASVSDEAISGSIIAMWGLEIAASALRGFFAMTVTQVA